tara:strand:+ start:719 stop:1867 length:1149 start_codon:yes stop_codon:yes gene_type:complete
MLKNKIYKYFTIEIIKTFITILFAFTAIAWTVRAVNFLDLVVENGHSVKVYLLFSLLNITNIITKFIPISFLLSLVVSILKFERQNELIILWTAGLNKMKLVNLFFLISILALIIQISFATFVTPNALNKSRNLIKLSDFDSVSSIIKINDFSDSFKDLTFYVQNRNQKNEMKNIFIRDDGTFLKGLISNDEDSVNTTVTAKSGYINNKKLILTEGSIQSKGKEGKLNNVNFKKTEISIDSLKPRAITVPKLQETTTPILFKCLFKNNIELNKKSLGNCPQDNLKREVVETISRRVGMPFYIPLVSLICCFLLISNRGKKYKTFKKYLYFALSFLVLVLAEILVRYSGLSRTNTVLYFIFPFLLTPFVYLILIRSMAFERVK